MIRRLIVGLIGILMAGSFAYGQNTYTSADNKKSDWYATTTWSRSPAGANPTTPGNPTNSSASAIRIYGYVRIESGGLTVNNANPVITVYDTLYIVGNVLLGSGASMNVRPGGLLVIVGNLTLAGSFSMVNNGNVVVTGNTSVTNGSITNNSDHFYVYGSTSASGGGTIDGCNPYSGCTPASQVQTRSQLHTQNRPLEDFVSGGGVLPVELLSFTVAKESVGYVFRWSTASELNFDYFMLQRSVDGNEFNDVVKIQGHGTTSERHDYIYEEDSAVLGQSYYRLKSVDFDGHTEYSAILKIENEGAKMFSVSPNPSNGLTFTANLNFVPKENEMIVVYDNTGSEHARFSVTGNETEFSLPSRLNSGVYYVKYTSRDFTQVFRMIVN